MGALATSVCRGPYKNGVGQYASVNTSERALSPKAPFELMMRGNLHSKSPRLLMLDNIYTHGQDALRHCKNFAASRYVLIRHPDHVK